MKAEDLVTRKALRKAMEVNPADLGNEYAKLASVYARYMELYSEAIHDHLTAKRAKELAEANAYVRIKEDALKRGKKLTEKEISYRVEVDEAYDEACATLITAEANKHRLFGICDSLRRKSEAVISLGAHQRAEMSMGGAGTPRNEDDDQDD